MFHFSNQKSLTHRQDFSADMSHYKLYWQEMQTVDRFSFNPIPNPGKLIRFVLSAAKCHKNEAQPRLAICHFFESGCEAQTMPR